MPPHMNLLGFFHTEKPKKKFLNNPKFHGLVFGLVELIDAKGIGLAQPI